MMADKMRVYTRSHPWLTFRLDLASVPFALWVQLGEAISKCEHLARVPMKAQLAHDLHQVYLAKGVHATTAIEGNTLSERQVLEQVQGRLKVPQSQNYLRQEVDNILDAMTFILNRVADGSDGRLDVPVVCELNRRVLQNLDVADHVVPGDIRSSEVSVGRYSGAPAQDCHFLIQRLCDWLNEPGFQEITGSRTLAGMFRALVAHLYLAWIHPFGDGNGRTARLLEVWCLLFAGVPTPAVHLLSNHFNLTRERYYRELDRASASGGDLRGFLTYAVEGFVDGLREQVDLVWDQQMALAWRDMVYERLPGEDKVSRRRRRLGLDLPHQPDEAIAVDEVPELTPKLATHYAVVGRKTLLRDVQAMVAMGLVEETGGRIRAHREVLQAFRPLRRTD